jgi:sigma-B regulation protein RsbU (phosphoserine phosphatase)
MVDPQAGSGRYVSAGHVDCLLAKAGGEAVRLQSTGAPLGLLPPGLAFEETVVAIDPGDCLVLFSDGVADAQNEAGEEFGDQRLLDIVKASRLQPAAVVVDRVFGAIDEFAAGAPQFDDITIMVLQRELSLKSSGGREPSVS